jgi:asparagine synthase (glutamine-hydrolysing)
MKLLKHLKRNYELSTLKPVTRAVVKDKLTYLPAKKLQRLESAISQTARLRGDILEFGVALGGSGIILAHEGRPARKFHGFDVFAMIPPPTSAKDDAKSKDRYEVIRSGKAVGIDGDEYYGYREDLLTDVKASFARHGVRVDGMNIILHKGLFEETWDTANIGRISLAHIDCDWYDPVMFCLRSCAEKLVEGGLIVIDDYNDYGGCRKAVDEFLTDRDDFAFDAGANPILRKLSANKSLH